MIKKLLLVTVLSGLLVSCNTKMSRSVVEPLTPEEINSITKDDKMFLFTYAFVESVVGKMTSAAEKSLWSDLTYKRFHQFINKVKDENFTDQLKAKYGDMWNAKYAQDEAKVDSVLSYWENYKKENALDTYIKVELVDIPNHGYSDLQFAFKITPLRGTIDVFKLYYGVYEDGNPPFYSYFETTGRNLLSVEQPFSQSIILTSYPTLDDDIRVTAMKMSASELLAEYNFDCKISYIKQDGKILNFVTQTAGIPRQVENLLSNRNKKDYSEWEREYDRTTLIKEHINKDYLGKEEYISSEIKKEVEAIDKLASDFYALTYK